MEVFMKLSYRYLVLVLGIVLLLFPILAIGCGPQPSVPSAVPSTDGNKGTASIVKEYAAFEVGAPKLSRNGVSVGEAATVSTDVTNTGGIPGTYKAVLTVNGQQADQKDVSIGPGQTQSVSFQVTKSAPGVYQLQIGDSSATLGVYKWPYTIQYDLGNAVGTEAWSLSGDYGHILHFTPPTTPFKIQKIDAYVHGTVNKDSDWYDRFVTVRIWNSDRTQQLWTANLPWRDFWNDVGSFWKTIEVPNVSTNGDFYVEIVTHSDQFGSDIGTAPRSDAAPAIFVAYDWPNPYQTSPIPTIVTRSGVSNMGQPVEVPVKYQGLNWLIRVEGDGSL
jgi:hypothetical protein